MNKTWGDLKRGDILICVEEHTQTEKTIVKNEKVKIDNMNHSITPIHIFSLCSGYNYGWVTIDYLNKYFEPYQNNKGELKMETLKQYFRKHSDTFITLGIIILIDEYLFGGSLRSKIQGLLDRLLNNTAKKLEAK